MMAAGRWAFNSLQPLALGSFMNWVRLLRDNPLIEPGFAPRVALTSLLSLMTAPLRLYERLHYERAVEATDLLKEPVFILGHWRAGTTHLHSLMSQDPNLGYISTWQTLAPGAYLTAHRSFRGLIARLLPPTRMMDNMRWSLDSPQEEEYAIANLSPYSFYHHWSFPLRARDYFERYVLFQGISQTVLARWKATYLAILGKATLSAAGRRLVIKNPTNTGRLPALLDLFPNAKFIHIYRDPYRVYPSTLHLYRSVLPTTQLQRISRGEVEANILRFYRQLMQSYLAHRGRIPAGNLVEVSFEALESDPLKELGRIYATLGLPGYRTAEPSFRAYLAARRGYQKNRFILTQEQINRVAAYWGFALQEWGYAPPSAG